MGSAQSIDARRERPAVLARELGVRRQSVHELVKRGILHVDADGRIDVELARVAILQRVRPSGKTARKAAAGAEPGAAATTPAPADGGPITSYHVARTLREATEARIAQLELAKRRGELVNAADVERNTFKVMRMLRDRLTSIADRTAAIVAAESDVSRCHAVIAAEVRDCLQSTVDALQVADPSEDVRE